MAIPASVILYANWDNGTGTYTAASPDVPNAHSWTMSNVTKAVESASPWNGQTIVTLNAWNSNVSTTLSSSTMQATSGRVLVEMDEQDPTFYRIMRFSATDANNGDLWVVKSGGNLKVMARWNGDTSTAEVSLGTYPTVPFAVEFIYDLNNGTANQRLRARTWNIGSSAGSMNNATSTAGSAATSDQFTSFNMAPDGEMGGFAIGRIAVSNSTSEDLSNLSEGGGSTAVPVFAHHYKTQGIQ